MPLALADLPSSTEDERFQVRSRLEIVSLLRGLVTARVPVTIAFGEGEEFIVTSLLAVEADSDELIFDLGAQRTSNQRLLASQRQTVSAILDQVKLQFQADGVAETLHDDLPAIRLRLPESLLRFQRRNTFRVRTPVARPIAASLPDPAQPGRKLALRVVDLSCEGVSLLSGANDTALQPGALLRGCRIDLPELGPIITSLEVRTVSSYAEGLQRNLRRYGCRFADLAPGLANLVQRYITRMQRESLAKR